MVRMFPGKEIKKNTGWLMDMFDAMTPSKPVLGLKWVMVVCGIFGSLDIMYSLYIVGTNYPYNPVSFFVILGSLPAIIGWSMYSMWLYDETFPINE